MFSFPLYRNLWCGEVDAFNTGVCLRFYEYYPAHPKGPCAESARAVTGRRVPLMKTGVTRKQYIRRCWNGPHANGLGTNAPVPKNAVPYEKNGNQNPDFWVQKKRALLDSNHVLATTGKSCQQKKVPLSPLNISLLGFLECFFGEKRIFGPFSPFRENVKTAVSS